MGLASYPGYAGRSRQLSSCGRYATKSRHLPPRLRGAARAEPGSPPRCCGCAAEVEDERGTLHHLPVVERGVDGDNADQVGRRQRLLERDGGGVEVGGCGIHHVAEVRLARVGERRGNADDHRLARAQVRVATRRDQAPIERRQPLRGDVLHVAAGLGERVDLAWIRVEPPPRGPVYLPSEAVLRGWRPPIRWSTNRPQAAGVLDTVAKPSSRTAVRFPITAGASTPSSFW